METLKAIAMRRSTRSYTSEQIKDSELDVILKAAKLAPLARGIHQNVHITVLQNQEIIGKINEIASLATGHGGNPANHGAPTLVIVSVKRANGSEIANAACMVENMLLAAADIGLGSVYIWTSINIMQNNAKLVADLGIPEGFSAISAVALGYPAQTLEGEKEPRPIGVNFVK